jgi:hypothetical protein
VTAEFGSVSSILIVCAIVVFAAAFIIRREAGISTS